MTIKSKPVKPKPRRSWLILLAVMTLFIPLMGLVLVWSGIEKTDTTYSINVAQTEARERQILRNKLEVERDRLLSPYELRRKAEQFGMKEPKAGQIRRMELQ